MKDLKHIEISLIGGKGHVLDKKICKTQREVYVFERDAPAKYGLLFSGLPYYIKKRYEYNN